MVFEKGGVIHVLPIKAIEELAGFAPGLSHKDLRDKKDRF